MSLQGGSQKQKSSSTQQSQSTGESQQFGSDLWGGQSPFLQDLYAKGAAALGGAADTANQYLGQANDMLGRSNEALGRFINPGQDPALASMATNLGQQFNEQFLPGLKGEAALAGGLGGSRQQIGAALGSQRAQQTLADFTAQTYSDQQNRALAAAQGLASNATTGGQFAEFAQGMPWYGLNQYAGLLGSPITLDKGGYSKQQSTGQGTSSGSGSGWNAGIGYNATSGK